MTFILDASVTLAWCFDDESSVVADHILARLEHETALTPAHWPLEVANALWSAERRGRLEASELLRVQALLTALPIDIAPVELSTALGVVDTARTHDLSVYDAVYLGLAAARGLPLATLDLRLRAAALRAGLEVID